MSDNPTYFFTSDICKIAFQRLFIVETSDVHLIIKEDGKTSRIPAHKNLLSSMSPVFAAMFTGDWIESYEVNITDASVAAFNGFLEFFYKNGVRLEEENVPEILRLAHKYAVEEITEILSTFLSERISESNVFDYLQIALLFNVVSLKDKCNEFISVETSAILKSKEFLECDLDILRNILKLSSFSCKEEIVFDACMKWAANVCALKNIDGSNVKNLRTELGDCFNLIRFKEMDEIEFFPRYASKKDMFSRDEIDEVLLNFFSNKSDNQRYLQRLRPLTYFCEFKPFSNQRTFEILYADKFCFCVNGVVLLKAINFGEVFCKINGESRCIETKMTVGILNTATKETIHDSSISVFGKNAFFFRKPLLIENDEMYEITIESRVSPDLKVRLDLFKFTTTHLSENITFETCMPYESISTMISSLVFDHCGIDRYFELKNK